MTRTPGRSRPLELLGWLVVGGVLAALPRVCQGAADPLDWPSWRGPEQNGISREKGLIDSWDPDGENLLWKRADLGSISTPIVMRGKLYLICHADPGTHREGERVVCVDPATGKTIWENRFNVYLSDVPDTRVSWSSCVGDPETGRVYALGVCGYFQCLDGETGKTIWSRSMSEEFGLLTTYGGRTNVPVMFEDLVIISGVMTGWGELAIPAHRFAAFRKDTGELVWLNGTRLRPEDTTYSTPTVTVLAGQAALVFGSGDGGIYAFQPRTGQMIWKFDLSRRGINTSPLVVGDTIYAGHSEENIDDNTMGSLAAIDGSLAGDITKSGARWLFKERMIGKSSPLVVGNQLFAVDDSAGLFVYDTVSGEPIGKRMKLGSMMRSSLVYADGKIFATEMNGRCYILRPTESGLETVSKCRLPSGEECQGSPIVSHGRVYIPSTGHLYCLGTADQVPSADPIPAAPVETPPGKADEPAWVAVYPAEVLLKPGQTQKFVARLYNARGQFLRESAASFSVDANGEIDDRGTYTAASSASHDASIVTAKVGELSGTARVRVVPPLPWKFDFSDAEVPITWVGARYRHQIRELDGNQVMVKVTTIPKGTRSQSWMGPTDLDNYTIQADVRGSLKDGKLPDMGLIAQRYTLDLMGASQQLQIRSWTAQLEVRFAKTIPFTWQPDTWYTLKFQASVESGQAVLRGKVWPRGEPEPEAWTIEAADAVPNVVGSPGLFGNASNAEIFIDNVSIAPNR